MAFSLILKLIGLGVGGLFLILGLVGVGDAGAYIISGTIILSTLLGVELMDLSRKNRRDKRSSK